MRFEIPPVYPITDKVLAGKTSHLAIIRELVRGGASLVQIRDKSTPVRELLADLTRCVEFAAEHDVILIINDRCDLAMSCDADGVHLGQEDLPPDAARSIMGRRKIIGYSTHSRAQVRRACGLPVDYIGFGPVFPTSTKENPSAVVGLAALRSACRQSSKPIVAIGGIGPAQIRDVLDAGAASVALISALMKAPNLARSMEQFLKTATNYTK